MVDIVDEDVEASMIALYLGEQGGDVGIDVVVDLTGDAGAAEGAYPLGCELYAKRLGRRGARFAAPGYVNRGATFAKPLCDSLTNAAARAGYHGNLAR